MKELFTMAAQGGIASIGELLVEFMCAERNGHNRVVSQYSGPFASGAPGIFIDQSARCGGRCIFVGAVGDDAFGEVVLDRLKADGVDTSLIATIPGIPTGSAFVSYNDDGSRDFVFNIAHSAASHLVVDDSTLKHLMEFGTNIIHVSGSVLSGHYMREKVMKVCRSLHAQGVMISFDPNIRKELISDPIYFDAISELTDICTYFLPSEDDVDVQYPGESLESFAPKLFAKNAEFVVLKKGAMGCVAIHKNGENLSIPAHQIDVVDPTGAGDCFCATFVTLMSSGKFTFKEALQFANAAGALAVTKLGPMEGNSTLPEIESFLAQRS